MKKLLTILFSTIVFLLLIHASNTYVLAATTINIGTTNNFIVSDLDNYYTYTGQEITPDFSIAVDGEVLVHNVDYILTFSNNTKVGTATIKITGIGKYTGSRTLSFIINRSSMNSSNVKVILNQNTIPYTGQAIKPTLFISLNGVLLPTSDYVLAYYDNVEVGTATITITGQNNMSGSLVHSFTIQPANLETVSINNFIDSFVYSGAELTQSSMKLIYNNKSLVSNADYSLKYVNNINVGTAQVTITGKGNFRGSITYSYKITAKDITTLPFMKSNTALYYTGKEQKLSFSIKHDKHYLVEGRDYIVTYKNNVNKGNATLSIIGIGNYYRSFDTSYVIYSKSIKSTKVYGLVNKEFTGSVIYQDNIIVKDGTAILKEGKDYTVSYSNNIGKANSNTTATVTIQGLGNYNQTTAATFIVMTVKNPAKPKSLKVVGYNSNSVTVAWNAVSNADYYKVRYRYQGETSYKIKTVKGTSYKIIGLKTGKVAEIAVSSYRKIANVTYYSAYTSNIKATVSLKSPSLTYVYSTSNSIKVKWDPIETATNYTVEYKVAGSNAFKKISTKGTSATIKKLKSNSVTAIRVSAYRKIGSSLYSSSPSKVKKLSTLLTTPDLTSSRKSSKVTISLPKNTTATYHEIYMKNNNGQFVLLGKVKNNKTFKKVKLNKNNTYTFKIRSAYRYNDVTVYSKFSKELQLNNITTSIITVK